MTMARGSPPRYRGSVVSLLNEPSSTPQRSSARRRRDQRGPGQPLRGGLLIGGVLIVVLLSLQLRHKTAPPPVPRAVWVTIPEGWRIEQVAQRLAAAGVANAQDVIRLAYLTEAQDRAANLFGAIPLVSSRPETATLEGYLFPDTYQMTVGMGATSAITQMLRDFATRVAPIAQRFPANIRTILIVASLVERETYRTADRPLIAQVYYNRLAGHEGGYLDADPTVQYVVGYRADQQTWWPMLSPADLDIVSSYNTYGPPHGGRPGLPPGPIDSPGMASLWAAALPARTDAEYFFADSQGITHYCVTLQCQTATIAGLP